MRRVAEQGDASERPLGERVTVDHRVLIDGVGPPDELWDVDPVEAEVAERRRRLLGIGAELPVLLRHRLAVGGLQLGYPVDERTTFLGEPARDRIDDHSPLHVADQHHRASVDERRALRDPPPHRDAVPERRAFVPVQRSADDGVHAVATDQHVTVVAADRRARAPVDELRPGAVRVVAPDGRDGVTGVVAVGAEPLMHGAVEDAEELSTVDRVLRPVVPRGDAAVLTEHALTVPVEEDECRRRDRGGRELVAETELDQLTGRVGEDVHTDPELAHLAHGLVDLDVLDPGGVQAERQGASPDPAADDDDLHRGHAVTLTTAGRLPPRGPAPSSPCRGTTDR